MSIRIYLFVFVLSISIPSMAQEKSSFSIESLPGKLEWIEQPEHFAYESGILKIHSGPETDMFIDPQGEYKRLNAPGAVFKPSGYFQLSARVQVDFNSKYDAGVLILYANDSNWAKLCFEYSPQGDPMVVSVVTRGISDDANNAVIEGPVVYLRVSGLGKANVLHYSLDGKFWHFVRYFHMETDDPLHVGFLSQSPTGKGCEAKFSNIVYLKKKLEDLRNGS
jgi:regulation of enolase protein 1 (concanavalin A-like superfamily)